MSDMFRNENWRNRLQKALGLGVPDSGVKPPDTGVCDGQQTNQVRIVSAGLITPDPSYTSLPSECLVGRLIKVPFQTGDSPVEHMWVTVSGVDGNTLIGRLDSDPVVTDDLKYGDLVRVSRKSIVAMHLTFREWSEQADDLRQEHDYWNLSLGSPIGPLFDGLYNKGLSPRQALTWWRDWEPFEDA
jgi:hypothetical protein